MLLKRLLRKLHLRKLLRLLKLLLPTINVAIVSFRSPDMVGLLLLIVKRR